VVLVFAGMTRSVGFSFAGITASFAAVVACGSPRGEARHHFCIRSHVSVGGRRPQACQSVQSCRAGHRV